MSIAMRAVSTVDALLRPAEHGLESDDGLGTLHERFGAGGIPPTTIGRYLVAGRLGAGGLGIVYRAFDPVLSRYVAIKVLKGGGDSADRDVRLLREAQVLARIRHPHVVEVFDVGFFEHHGVSRFFVAMELLEGHDLSQWLAHGRSLEEIRGAFLAAAEGLAAAHAQGLLHRDFKPSNVLMSEDDTVKVADFGLAAMTQELRAEAEDSGWPIDGSGTLSLRPGGTLPYMSPEQHRGEPLGPASDQFAFCVSLYEAVYGRRPFEGRDGRAILAAKASEPTLLRTPLAPASMRRLLARGLRPRAEDRFSSMEALHEALASVNASSWRSWLAVTGAVIVGAITAVATIDLDEQAMAPSCASPPASLAQTSTTTPEIEAVLADSPPLARAWPAMLEALDDYAVELRRRWDVACSLAEVERERAQRCLMRCGEGLTALRELLDAGERETLALGWSLVRALPDVQACDPDRSEPRSGELDATIAGARMLATAGRLAAAREILQAERAEPAVREDPRARRDLDIELAELLALEGHHTQAKPELERIYFEAVSENDALGASRAAVWLVAQGYRTGDVEGARQWSRAAQTQLERVQPRHYELEAMAAHNLALAHLGAGELVESLAIIRTALEHASAPGVPTSIRRATQQVYAEILMLNGRPAEALAIHLDLLHTDQAPPQRDPLAAVVDLQSLGNARMTLHDLDGAWAAYGDALETGRSVLGLDHPDTAAACISFAWVQGDRGQTEEGLALLAPCLQRLIDSLGEEHPHVALTRAMQGRLESQAGRPDEAVRLLEAALASLERSVGESHYAVGDVLHELGLARASAGDGITGRATLEHALRVRRAALPSGHVSEAETMAELARLELEAGEREAAREHLVAALEIFEDRELEASYVARWRERLQALDASR